MSEMKCIFEDCDGKTKNCSGPEGCFVCCTKCDFCGPTRGNEFDAEFVWLRRVLSWQQRKDYTRINRSIAASLLEKRRFELIKVMLPSVQSEVVQRSIHQGMFYKMSDILDGAFKYADAVLDRLDKEGSV